jgi:hypothetical protein
MTSTPMQAMARAVSALVADHDVTDVLTRLLFDALDVMDAAAAGLLILRPDGSLEVLTATSHRALDLEMYEAQERVGPCAEAIATNASVVSEGAEMHERWPVFAASMEASGYHAVQAHPLRWHGRVLGAINVFHAGESCSVDEAVGQAFADVATLGVLTPAELDGAEINQLVDTALGDRTVIEQAKGVLAYQHTVSIEEAYQMLVGRARDGGLSLTREAERVVKDAYRG